MKKTASSLFLIVVFALYSWSRRGMDVAVPVVPANPAASSVSSVVSDAPVFSSSASSDTQVPVPPPVYIQSSAIVSSRPASQPAVSQASSAASPPSPPSSSSKPQGMYKDGTYTSPSVDAYYGNVQIQVAVQNGRIATVQFLDFPRDRRQSEMINSYATPMLQSEAIQTQTAPVDIVSGATATSDAFNQSFVSVLAQARNL